MTLGVRKLGRMPLLISAALASKVVAATLWQGGGNTPPAIQASLVSEPVAEQRETPPQIIPPKSAAEPRAAEPKSEPQAMAAPAASPAVAQEAESNPSPESVSAPAPDPVAMAQVDVEAKVDAKAEPEPAPVQVATAPAEPAIPNLAPLRAALQNLHCAIVDVAFQDGRMSVSGVAAGESARARLAALVAEHAQGWPHDSSVRLAAPALCEPLSLIGPLRAANLSAPVPVSIRLETPEASFRGGTSLTFDIAAPDFPAHLQVDYYTADGNVVHLLPNPLETSGQVDSGAVRRLGDRKSGGRFWTIGPPFGRELIVVMASASPLFTTPRPEAEAASAYLSELKRVLDVSGAAALADARFIVTAAP